MKYDAHMSIIILHSILESFLGSQKPCFCVYYAYKKVIIEPKLGKSLFYRHKNNKNRWYFDKKAVSIGKLDKSAFFCQKTIKKDKKHGQKAWKSPELDKSAFLIIFCQKTPPERQNRPPTTKNASPDRPNHQNLVILTPRPGYPPGDPLILVGFPILNFQKVHKNGGPRGGRTPISGSGGQKIIKKAVYRIFL